MSEKGSERRRHRRIRKRYTVRFGVGDFAHTGYTQDISESGLYLMANATFVPGTILQVQIEYPEKTITVRGVVRWAKAGYDDVLWALLNSTEFEFNH